MWLELAAIQSFHRGYNRFASPFKLSSLLKLEFGIPNPIVINSTLHSEYLPCVYEALLLDSDLEVNQVIFVLTSILTFSIIIIVYSYTLKVFDSHIAAVLSTPIVFFLGGYAIVNALDNNSRLSSSIEYRFNTGLGQYQPWGHEMLHCLLTSRLCLLCLALSSLVYSFLEFNLDCSAGIIAWIVIFLRPPSAAVLFFAYLFYKWQKIHIRAFFAVVAALLLYIQKIHVTFGVMYSNHWPYQPIIGYLWNIFGIIPIGCILGYLFTKKIAPISAIASLITILFVNLQESHRFNFFAVITSVYPVLAAFFAGGFMDLTFISKKKSKQGAIDMLIVLIIASSCLSGVVGYIHRLDQTIEVFPDNTAKETGLWIAKNTKSNTTFLSIVDRVWTPSVFYAGRRELTTTDQAFQAVPFKPINYIVALNEWMTGNVTSWNMTDVILIQNTAQYADVIKRKADAAMKLLYSNDDYFVYTN
ncbi:hypothetical protein TVAG_060400 [Trichomonas vaginalis G3]|uniref:Transmembrane protein n=1 Tax=Trichomonas vaginalis (strain ATCC PRA-98 / G3) TaxID=412133 RepID=A2ECG9_TRIV3|nr:hypothetical protein TVAGG3_0311760 [Trichomonas vaginalis G3]EAY09664.1 hypothetical protein TVAG_060400 [Trichomonas vaginalis G3]KAI5528665.1 hypothetical protein TVAGG3_0311760 [Trichomonas vaginalis G3]|eukprot:XP_001321887.1 hypothetical protein [Trichomonas vaginalis G3]